MPYIQIAELDSVSGTYAAKNVTPNNGVALDKTFDPTAFLASYIVPHYFISTLVTPILYGGNSKCELIVANETGANSSAGLRILTAFMNVSLPGPILNGGGV
jgi:hypothetical protein